MKNVNLNGSWYEWISFIGPVTLYKHTTTICTYTTLWANIYKTDSSSIQRWQ